MTQKSIYSVFRKHRKRLLAMRGVHYLDIGYKYSDDKRVGDALCIRMFVHKKFPTKMLPNSDRFPAEIDGFATDVIECSWTKHGNGLGDTQVSVLEGGVQIEGDCGAGTLGGIFWSEPLRQFVGLTARHVLVEINPEYRVGKIGDPIFHPKNDGHTRAIGRILDFDRKMDAGIVGLLPGVPHEPYKIHGLPFRIETHAMPVHGMRLRRVGIASVTEGEAIIDGIAPNHQDIPTAFTVKSGESASCPGDSGALWIDMDTHLVVGLNYAGSTSICSPRARALSAPLIFERFGLQFSSPLST